MYQSLIGTIGRSEWDRLEREYLSRSEWPENEEPDWDDLADEFITTLTDRIWPELFGGES